MPPSVFTYANLIGEKLNLILLICISANEWDWAPLHMFKSHLYLFFCEFHILSPHFFLLIADLFFVGVLYIYWKAALCLLWVTNSSHPTLLSFDFVLIKKKSLACNLKNGFILTCICTCVCVCVISEFASHLERSSRLWGYKRSMFSSCSFTILFFQA